MRRLAATLSISALTVGGLAATAIYAGPTLWALTAPADRLGALVAQAERDLAQRRAANATPGADALGADGLALTGASRATAASRGNASSSTAVDDARREPFSRVGARTSLAEPTPAPARPGEAAVSGEAEPAFTVEVVRGQAVYRMNGDVIGDPGQHGEQMVEAGYEYRFGKRGLEKVKLWEVRR